jgi:hypothetical protein
MRMKRAAILSALIVTILASALPAGANGFRNDPAPVSVFPVQRDPWRSWGVRRELSPHVRGPRVDQHVVVEPAPVWVPAQWVWDGATWVWWPGQWVR